MGEQNEATANRDDPLWGIIFSAVPGTLRAGMEEKRLIFSQRVQIADAVYVAVRGGRAAEEPMTRHATLTNAQFAEWCARIASNAAAWAADIYSMKDDLQRPVRPDVPVTFTAAITNWLDAINGRR